jgi:diacylglycerol kinase family enzyme
MAERTRGISVIINERSGAAARPDAGAEIQTLFARAGAQARLERVREPGDIAARARQAASRGDVLVAAGGDGTVSGVAGVAVEISATFGVLPMGTLNHFAKDVGLPLDLEGAVSVIVAGHVRHLDVGDVNGRIFVNNSSVGLYPRMVLERKAEQRRGHRKWTAFAIAMLRTWRDYRMVAARLVVDGKEAVVYTPFIFVGNNHYGAEGFQLGGRSRLDEGRLSIFMAPDAGRFEVLTLPLRALANRLSSAAPFLAFQADTVAVDMSRRRVSVALDGEVAIMRAPLVYRVRPRALRAIVAASPDEP